MENKKILLICYYFPSLGGAGISRPLALYKYLQNYGYDCDVLTVKPVTYRVYEPEQLLGLDSSRIFRSGSYDPQRLLYLLGMRKIKNATIDKRENIKRKFFPDSKIGWVKPAVKLGKKLISGNNYVAILSTSPPISAHLVAYKLAEETHIPWIADFRDFWESLPLEKCYTNINDIKRAQRLLEKIKGKTSVVTAVNSSIASYLGDAEIIYNSFDDELATEWSVPLSRDFFTIGLFGSFNELCPVEPLLIILSKLREKNPERFQQIRLRQVGQVDRNWFRELLKKYNMLDMCQIYGFQPRLQAVKLMSKASLFYISLNKEEIGIVPGRLYLLFSSGRKIIGYASSKSELTKLIESNHAGMTFSDINDERIINFMDDQISKYFNNELHIEILPTYSLKYSSGKMVESFAGLLKTLENAPWLLK